jgi:hypothetical protein
MDPITFKRQILEADFYLEADYNSVNNLEAVYFI